MWGAMLVCVCVCEHVCPYWCSVSFVFWPFEGELLWVGLGTWVCVAGYLGTCMDVCSSVYVW